MSSCLVLIFSTTVVVEASTATPPPPPPLLLLLRRRLLLRLLLLMPPARVSKIRKFVCCAGGGDCGDRRARTSFCAAILLAGPSPPTPPPPPLLLLLLLLLLLFSLSCARSSSFLRPLPCSGIDVVRDSVQRPVVFFPCLFIATQPMHFEMNLPFSRPREELVRFFFMANSIRLLYSIRFSFFLSFSSFSLLFLPCLPVCLFYFLALPLFFCFPSFFLDFCPCFSLLAVFLLFFFNAIQVVFEEFGFAACYRCPSAALSCYHEQVLEEERESM